MAKRVLFVQGAGEGAHAIDARMAAALQGAVGPAYAVDFPFMPDEASSDRPAWSRWLTGLLARNGHPLVVAHSAGALQLLLALAEGAIHPRLEGLFLIAAPFCGEGGWRIEGNDVPEDLAARVPPGLPIHLYQGDRDQTVPPQHLELYARFLPKAFTHRLAGRDHQLNDDLSEVAEDILALNAR